MTTEDIAREIFIRAVGEEDFMGEVGEGLVKDPTVTRGALRAMAGMSFVMAEAFVEVAKARDQPPKSMDQNHRDPVSAARRSGDAP